MPFAMRSKARAEPCCQPGSIIEQGPEVDRGAFVCFQRFDGNHALFENAAAGSRDATGQVMQAEPPEEQRQVLPPCMKHYCGGSARPATLGCCQSYSGYASPLRAASRT